MGIKGRRVHIIEEMSNCVISFQRGKILNLESFIFLIFLTDSSLQPKTLLLTLCIVYVTYPKESVNV